MLRIFVGVDDRQPLSYNVLHHSIVRHATVPVAVTPLRLSTLPIQRKGLTEFTYTRYLVPWLCDFQGWALFLDSDMLVLGDINELFQKADDQYAVMVVQNKMRFEWPSLMLFNCKKCEILTPSYVEKYGSPQDMSWAGGMPGVGNLPAEWNHCSNYDSPNGAQPKLVHYTQGIPCWHETADSDFAAEWIAERDDMLRICTWKDIMAISVHAQPVLERMMRNYAKVVQEHASRR